MFIYLLLASNLCALRAPLPRQLVNMPSPKLSALTQASSVVTVKVASLSAAQSNPWFIWSLLFVSSTAGIAAEKTSIGAMLSSPLVTMALTLVMCNVGLLPSVSPIYDTVLKYLVPLAVPLLLLDADLKRCFGSMKQLLKAFFVGALGTVFGTIIAYAMVPMHEIPESINVAAALCGRHIGGAVNFIAISEITKIPSEIVTAAIAADNVVVAIYFALLFTISTPDKISMAEMTSSPRTTALSIPVPSPPKCPFPIFSQVDKNAAKSADEVQPLVDETQSLRNLSTTEVRVSRTETVREGGITLERLLGAVSLSFIICTISQYTGKALSWSPILISSFAAVAAATFFPNVVFPLSKSGGIVGVAFMQVIGSNAIICRFCIHLISFIIIFCSCSSQLLVLWGTFQAF